MPELLPSPIFVPPVVSVRPGTDLVTVDVYVYACPLCGNQFRYDDRYEPMCTGPRWTDDHAPEVMRFLRKDTRRIVL